MSDTQGTTPRRVLGSLAVNTPTTASKLRNPLSASHKPIPLPSIGPVCSPPRMGQKRSIDQVEGASPKSAARRGSPPPVEARENPIRVYEDVQTTPEPTEDKSCPNPANNPPRLTRTPLPDRNEGAPQAASQGTVKASTSSVVDLDPDDESVSSTQATPTEPPTPGQPTVRLHAETLRLRLRVAMFKINTHQTNIPLSRLQISPRKLVDLPAQLQKSPPQEAVTLQKAEAPIRPTISKLLPAPILVPTVYSARLIHDPPILSSPPTSISSSSSHDTPSPSLATPTLPQQQRSHPPPQLDSPPRSEERRAVKGKAVDSDANLPSSVIKGRAATGLLNLMNMGR